MRGTPSLLYKTFAHIRWARCKIVLHLVLNLNGVHIQEFLFLEVFYLACFSGFLLSPWGKSEPQGMK